jgi:S1-C subfamily serine protease
VTLRGSLIRVVLPVVVAMAAIATVVMRTHETTRSPRVGAGVVVIETSLGYQDARAAGTGMVLTPSGTVLTNNHVIRGGDGYPGRRAGDRPVLSGEGRRL